MLRSYLALTCVTFLVIAPTSAMSEARTPEHVASVVDGRTLRLDSGEYVRLLGLEVPDRTARCLAEARRADQATARLTQLAAGGLILDRHGHDSQKHTLATAGTVDGRDVAGLLIAERLAVPYFRHGPRTDWCRVER